MWLWGEAGATMSSEELCPEHYVRHLERIEAMAS